MDQLATTKPDLQVFEGIELHGAVNVPDEGILTNIAHSIRLGHPQVQPMPLQSDRILLVGGGPSLNETADELVQLYFEGAKIVALNGAVAWCLAHHLRPSAQILVDARPDNARFLAQAVPQLRYLIASQCAPETWAGVEGRENVWIWHAADPDGVFKPMLDTYYAQRWTPISGGTTSAMRGLALLRTLGYVRFDLFGIDSCWMRGQHHAYTQPENEADKRFLFHAHPVGHPEMDRVFECAPWHVKQAEDFLQLLKLAADQFVMQIHGDGLLAHLLRCAAELTDLEVEVEPQGVTR